MEFIDMLKYILVHGPEMLAALIAVLMALIGLFMAIPGAEPEASLQKIVDFLAKFSRKPKPLDAPKAE